MMPGLVQHSTFPEPEPQPLLIPVPGGDIGYLTGNGTMG